MLTFCLHRFLCACAPVCFTGMNQPLIVWHTKLKWTCSSLAGTWRTKTSGATTTCAWVTLTTVVGMSAYLLLSPSSAPVSSCHLGEPPVLSFGSAICVIMPFGSATCVAMSLNFCVLNSFLYFSIPGFVCWNRIGRDWQFDDSVSKIYGCKVLAYDPRYVPQVVSLLDEVEPGSLINQ